MVSARRFREPARGWKALTVSMAVVTLEAVATAQAQTTATQTTPNVVLDPVTVTGSGEAATGAVTGYVARQTATGSKTDTPIQEVPQAVSVLGRDEIEDRQPQKIDEALRYTAGVFAQPFGFDSDTDWAYIRGFDASQTGVFLDGLPLYQYAFGVFTVDPFLLERVEVLKGAASVLYGGSNPGGLINLVSKRPVDEPLRYIEAGVNTWGNAYVGVDLGGPIDKAGVWSYRLTTHISGGGNETDKADDFHGVVAPSLTWRPDAATSVTLLGQYQDIDLKHVNGFLPYIGTVVPAAFGLIARDYFYSEPDIDSYRRKQALVGYEAQHDVSANWQLRQNVRYGYLLQEEHQVYPFGYAGGAPTPPDYLLNRFNFQHHTEVNTVSIDNQSDMRFSTGPLDHRLLLGLDYKYYNIDEVQRFSFGTPLSATDPDYGAAQPATFPFVDENYTMHQLGAYAQDQVHFGDGWLVTLNGRYDRLWSDGDNRLPGSTDFSDQTGEFSGRAGVAYEFANGLTPYAAASRFFNPLVGTGVGGVPYTPETGHQYEAGVKYKPTGVDALVTASVFDLTREHTLTADPDGSFNSVQLGEVRSRGFELEGKATLAGGLKAIAAVTAYDIDVRKDTNAAIVGKRPVIVPEVLASLWLDYTVQSGALKGLGFGAGARYTGSSYADNLNTLKVPDATLFDAAVRYTHDKWSVALNVNNIADKRYVASCQSALTCYYGEGRVATLKASYSW